MDIIECQVSRCRLAGTLSTAIAKLSSRKYMIELSMLEYETTFPPEHVVLFVSNAERRLYI